MRPAPIGVSAGGQSLVPNPRYPNRRQAGSAATAPRNSPHGSAQRSSIALATYSGRGAIIASSTCWSIGSSAARPAYVAYLGQNQCGNRRVMSAVVSPTGRRSSAAPPHPDSFETTIANRSSQAPAHRAALPLRECPTTITRVGSTSGCCTSQSSTRDRPQAHVPIAPGSSGSSGPSTGRSSAASALSARPSGRSGNRSPAHTVAIP